MSARELSKMGAAKVALETSNCGHSVIGKGRVGEVEYCFYHDTAATLNLAGIATPKAVVRGCFRSAMMFCFVTTS